MKKIILAFAIALAATPAIAQTSATHSPKTAQTQRVPMSADQRAAIYTKELQTKLNLTTDQNTKVQAVNAECIRRKDAVKAGGQTANSGFKEIAAYRRQQFATILTPEQMAKLKTMNSEGGNSKLAHKAPAAGIVTQ